jgi:glycosyltransferase involved in cell wall biosynthesis
MSKRKYTVLHTEWSDGWGGQEHRILNEMLGMQRRGHRVLLATRAHAQIAERARKAGIEVFTLPFAGKFDLRTIVPLSRLAKRERVDIVNTHSGNDSWSGGLAAKFAGITLVRTRHLNIPLKRSWHNFVHELPACIVTCGETMRTQLQQECGFEPERLASIPTGVDFEQFAPNKTREQMRAELGYGVAEWLILMVGVIREVKRHDVALQAFARVYQKHPQARLLLAGDGPKRGDTEALAKELGIADAVRFLGHRNDVPDLMAASDCSLLTSRSEGVPQAVTQALGLGLPTVATAVGGVPELVIDGQTGLLAPSGDDAALAAALNRLIEQPALAKTLSDAARAHARGQYSLNAMLDATEALYARVLESAR